MKTSLDIKHALLSLQNVGLVAISVIGITILKLMVTWIYNIYFHPLRRFPGPTLAAASGLVFFYRLFHGEEAAWENKIHKKYGEIVRIAPDRLSFISPQAWKDIAGPGTGKRLENTKDPSTYGPNLRGDRSFGAEPDTETHRARRKIYAPAFSDKALKQQEPLILGHVDFLVNIIKEDYTCEPQVALDLCKLLNCLTFDIMADLTFGEPLGLLQQSEYTPWVHAVLGNVRSMSIARIALEHKSFQAVLKFVTPKSVKESALMHYNHSYNRVKKRLARGINIGKPDIWSLVMQRSEEIHLPMRLMAADAGDFMAAGTETTATLLSGLIYLLLKDPEHMRRLQAEVRALEKAELILEVLSSLPFMTACLSEALRIYPPTPIPFFRRTPKGGSMICGEWIPEDTRVAVSHYAAYHNPINFKNPDSFVPSRWLPGTTGYEGDRKDVCNPFSIGPRNCIGQNLANHEMRLILANLIWHFDFELSPESDHWIDNQKAHFLWVKPPLLVKAKHIR